VSRSAPKSCPATAKFCDYVKLKVEASFGNYSKAYISDVELLGLNLGILFSISNLEFGVPWLR
jgi:hypothetical protein